MELATLVVAIVTLFLTAATLALVAYDVYRRYRPILRLTIGNLDESVVAEEQLIIENVGGPTSLTQISLQTFGRLGEKKESIIWKGHRLLNTHGEFRTGFTLGDVADRRSFVVEMRHSGYILRRPISRTRTVRLLES